MVYAGSQSDPTLITHIVGARPNFPKAAPVIGALTDVGANQRLVHTGQHYDDALSDSFFRDLDLPRPDVNLGIGSGSHAQQTAALLTAIEAELTATKPGLLIVYGDVNSTMAAALVAAKLDIAVAHVEAGLRSFDRTMPEEINRIVTDRLSNLLFVTSPEAKTNLEREGASPECIHFVGNPMIDTLLSKKKALDPVSIRSRLGIEGPYAVATLHRPGNVDGLDSVKELITALENASRHMRIILPLHPRGRAPLLDQGLGALGHIDVIEPLGYLDFISLVCDSNAVITDSGGVQEETTILGIPCLTLRPNTERPVTISHGTNKLVTASTLEAELLAALTKGRGRNSKEPPPLWDGHAGERIAILVEEWMSDQ